MKTKCVKGITVDDIKNVNHEVYRQYMMVSQKYLLRLVLWDFVRSYFEVTEGWVLKAEAVHELFKDFCTNNGHPIFDESVFDSGFREAMECMVTTTARVNRFEVDGEVYYQNLWLNEELDELYADFIENF